MENLILDDNVQERPVRYAGFWIRAVAALIDSVIFYALFYLTLKVLGIDYFSLVLDPVAMQAAMPKVIIVALLLGFGYYIYFNASKYQGTPGKMVMGIKIGEMDGSRITMLKSVGRYFAYCLAAMILFIGLFMIGWDKKKQGLHDKICNTLVYYK